MNCSKCGKELDDFKIEISFRIIVNRMLKSGQWEYIPNLDNNSNEVLCYDCFDKFSEVISQLNLEK